jgi:hypothetical protein
VSADLNATRKDHPVFTALRRTLAVLVLPAAVVALAGPATAATTQPRPVTGTTVAPAPAVSAQGIIMRDGGICDPIRHMGC